jgi:hypothetical protein
MDKSQAFDLIAQATGLLKLTREEHKKVVEALELLRPVEEVKED